MKLDHQFITINHSFWKRLFCLGPFSWCTVKTELEYDENKNYYVWVNGTKQNTDSYNIISSGKEFKGTEDEKEVLKYRGNVIIIFNYDLDHKDLVFIQEE